MEEKLIERTGEIAKRWGFPEPAGRIWACLLLSEDPISQAEIASMTGYTLSLVSPSLRILEENNRIRKTKGKGKERLYTLNGLFIEAYSAVMQKTLERDIKPVIDELSEYNKKNKNKKLSVLISEYKRMEFYLQIFIKISKMKELALGKLKF